MLGVITFSRLAFFSFTAESVEFYPVGLIFQEDLTNVLRSLRLSLSSTRTARSHHPDGYLDVAAIILLSSVYC